VVSKADQKQSSVSLHPSARSTHTAQKSSQQLSRTAIQRQPLIKHTQLIYKSTSAEISCITTLIPFCLSGKKNTSIQAQKIGAPCAKPTNDTRGEALLPNSF